MKILENINKTTNIDIKQYSTGNKCKSKILKCEILQNAACYSKIGGICPFTASSTVQSAAMTDEQTNDCSNNKDCDYKETTTIANQTKECNKALSNDSDTNTKLKNSDYTLTETEKIFLRNGLNGTNTAVAAVVATATATLLTGSPSYQLPESSPCVPYTSTTDVTITDAAANIQLPSPTSFVVETSVNNSIHENLKFVSSRPLISSTAVNSPHLTLSNRLLDCNFAKGTTTISNALTNSNKLHKLKKKGNISKTSFMNLGIIDYTINNFTTTTLTSKFLLTSTDTKFLSSTNLRSNGKSAPLNYNTSVCSYFNNGVNLGNNAHFDYKNTKIDKTFTSHTHAISCGHTNSIYNNSVPLNSNISYKKTLSQVYGGRLQFFKDGKFILELARSKVGEKSGWVSVPRKQFRAPSAATSSTITPSSLANFTIQSPLPTSTVITSGAVFSKNECSNSLSFSDDNSSIQSSPWQRDHCWKQPAPQKNISKEMSLLYQRVRWVQLTPQGRNRSRLKRRKPYDTTVLVDELLFQHRVLVFPKRHEVEDTVNKTVLDAVEFKSVEEDLIIKSKSIKKSNIHCVYNESCIKDKQKLEESLLSNIKSPVNIDINGDIPLAEKMNISKADESRNSDEAIYKAGIGKNNSKDVIASKIKPDIIIKSNKMNRLLEKSKYKAKKNLTSIVQKLLEISCKHCIMSRSLQPPVPFSNRSSAAVSVSISFTASHLQNYNSNTIGHKSSSPSSNIATTRLVDCHHQHVSPRKRILREFEKVSLEDNQIIAGGKRSRAKGNIPIVETASTSAIGNNSNSKLSPSLSPSSSAVHTSHFIANMSSAVVLNKSTTACTTSAPTRLYSSYSILSLLGGTADISRRITKNDSAAEIVINDKNIQCKISSHNLPQKSPEDSGVKSPITISSEVKRPPSCISPTYDTHSRSPTAVNACTESAMRPPRSTADVTQCKFQKLYYAANTEHNSSASINCVNQPQNYMHLIPIDTHHQTYHSPYMTPQHYMPSRNISMTNTSTTISKTFSTSNPPRRHTSAFKAAAPTTVISSSPLLTSPSIYIPIQEDLSPTRSLIASPRDVTLRTVPKKTASTRRQFDSTTAYCGMTHNCYTSASLNRHEDRKHIDTRIVTTTISQYQNQLQLQNDSPSSAGISGVICATDATSSNLHSYPYIYPQIVNNSSNPPTILTTNVAASTVSSYIPSVISSSYYHPYISTLAAMRHSQMWMQNHQDAAVVAVGVAAAASPSLQTHRQPIMLANPRLSPPYQQNLQYNSISNAAAMAAAVVAAAGFGSQATSPSIISPVVASHTPFFAHLRAGREEMSPFSEKIDTYNSTSTTINNETSMKTVSPDNSLYSFNASDNTFKISPSMSQPSSFSMLHTASFSSTSNSTYQLNHKIEQTADVPLNLSKH